MEAFERLQLALADRYTLERQIGAGGMAEVYLAHDVRHNRKVAIKVMHRELAVRVGVDRFLREIETTAKLQHPHILPLFDSGRVEGTVFYVMPYVEGESLRARLQRETQLPVADAIRITTEVATGLGYAHRHGVIHRDIKPDNILFQDGQALIADFGLSLPQGDSSNAQTRMTQAGVTLGTPYYMSPEQAGAQGVVDWRTDIYALGVVMYEMLAGQPPFTGATVQSVFKKVMSEDPRPVSEHRKSIPHYVDTAVARALEKLPADRWQSASQFADALTGIGARAVSRASGRGAMPWIVAGVLAVGLGWTALKPDRNVIVSHGPTRFAVDFGPTVRPSYTPVVRLSEDGRRMIVSAMVDRREEVLGHSLDRLDMGVIQGAGQGDQGTGNSRPFVSPDGEWVAYARQKRLWKVPFEGGVAVALAAADWAGGDWGSNGKLVYTQAYYTGLWMVSEGGGDEHMLTAPDTTKAELGHWWPQILDDDHIIFTAYRTPLESSSIEVFTISTGERKLLLTGGVYGFYVPTGHLLFAVGESIRAAPFDVDRLEVTGAAIPVVDDVAMNLTDGAAAFDVSENGTLAYLPVESYITDVDLVFVNRFGRESPALPMKDRYNNPRLSPDETRIAVDIRPANSSGDVWVFEVGRSGGTRLTAEGGRDFGAEWTPDGHELIYSKENPYFHLYRRAADGSRPAELLLGGANDHYTGAVSRDGRIFAYVLAVPGGELWTVPLDGSGKASRYFSNGFNLGHPVISPDGRWIAYDSDESGRVDVFIQSFPDPELKRFKVSPAHGSEPMWTKGGRELVYRDGNSIMAVSIDLETGASGPPTLLFSGPYPDNPGWTRPRSYDVTPDGERFLMTKLPSDQAQPRVVVVLNWLEELKEKVPN